MKKKVSKVDLLYPLRNCAYDLTIMLESQADEKNNCILRITLDL